MPEMAISSSTPFFFGWSAISVSGLKQKIRERNSFRHGSESFSPSLSPFPFFIQIQPKANSECSSLCTAPGWSFAAFWVNIPVRGPIHQHSGNILQNHSFSQIIWLFIIKFTNKNIKLLRF
jgi:hypothetical protein